ncbi:GNAT family N-acetyltransferase [Halobellus sp. MBLA0160]|uniref:GNAT family N-acetyltransferase n=2 Tax=Halobellus ruber TaxID=2761102 RepID=A0A7J9SLR9_9EURY|nr:GNAT family N-acetyltransferase [Halobellus ruber]MBB6647890.1 GNAT family N-acetyltransferase [Halobellus ruber]
MLSFDRERVRDRVREGDALVAVVRGHNREERRAAGAEASDDRVVGACVLRRSGAGPVEIEQIAVHRSRRGRGIGAALVAAAATRTDGPLVARFREDVRPFYESLGFETEAVDGDSTADDVNAGGNAAADRLRGILR